MKLNETRQRIRAGVRAHESFVVGLIALLGVLVYANALGNPFVYDDHRLILDNQSLYNLSDWRAILFHDVSRPLVNLSYAIDYAIWGGTNSFGFHLTNLAIHVANIFLLFGLATVLSQDAAARHHAERPPHTAAVAAALLFAVHPALTQAVGYVSARAELLCAMFLMIAFMLARRAMRGGARWLWIPALGSWGLALASKEIAVMFPVALFFYDALISPAEPGARRRRAWRVHAPLLVLTAIAATVRLVVLLHVEHPGETVVRWRFGLVELDVLRRYVALLLAPTGQTIFHSINPIETLAAPRAILGLGTAALLGMAIWRTRRHDVVSFGLGWFVLLLVPSAVLVVLDRGEPMAEQRLYAASTGFFLAAGGVAGLLSERLHQVSDLAGRRIRDAGFVIIAILSLETVSRNVVWHRSVSLWLEAAEAAPDHWLPRLALAEALHDEGRHEEAISMYRESLALRPTEALALAKLGQCQLEMGRVKEAQESFEQLRALDPGSLAASTGLGLIALRARDSIVARDYFLEALSRDPGSVPMRQALSAVAEDTDPGEALRLCEEIRRLAPQTPGNEECIRRNRKRLEAANSAR